MLKEEKSNFLKARTTREGIKIFVNNLEITSDSETNFVKAATS